MRQDGPPVSRETTPDVVDLTVPEGTQAAIATVARGAGTSSPPDVRSTPMNDPRRSFRHAEPGSRTGPNDAEPATWLDPAQGPDHDDPEHAGSREDDFWFGTEGQAPSPADPALPPFPPVDAAPATFTQFEAAPAVQPEASFSLADESTPLALEVAEDVRRRINLVGRQLPRPPHTRVMTVANQKGGVGKTTTAVNLAGALAQAGLTVLVLDVDPQGNASTALNIDHHAEVPSTYDVLVDGKPLTEVIQECPDIKGLLCAPATIDLAGAEIELVSLVARESRLERALQAYFEAREARGQEPLDYVLIDCPPSLGLLTVNAFVAAQEVLIPIQCEYYALEGLSQLLRNVDLIKGHLNRALQVSTILLTMYDGRTRLSSQVADEVRTHFPTTVLRTTIPRSVRISEAPSFQQTVITYDPTSSGALSYLEAAREMAEKGPPATGGRQRAEDGR
jgi:chromosome partitioning protein